MVNNILITGSNSYLGKEVVKKICTNNYFALDSRKINNSQITPIKNFRDIKENKIDTLYHFANFLSEKDGLYSFKDENLFLNEVMKNGIKNILYSGTYWSEMIEYKDLDYVKHKNLITEKLINSNNEKKIIEANLLREKLDGKKISMEMEANDDGSLYGAVSQKSISESIFDIHEIKILPDAVILDPIKEVGETEIQIRLYEDIKANLHLQITKKT